MFPSAPSPLLPNFYSFFRTYIQAINKCCWSYLSMTFTGSYRTHLTGTLDSTYPIAATVVFSKQSRTCHSPSWKLSVVLPCSIMACRFHLFRPTPSSWFLHILPRWSSSSWHVSSQPCAFQALVLALPSAWSDALPPAPSAVAFFSMCPSQWHSLKSFQDHPT